MQLLAIANRFKFEMDRLQRERPDHPFLDWKTYIHHIEVHHCGLLNHTLQVGVLYKQKPEYEGKQFVFGAFDTSGWLSLEGKEKDPLQEINKLIEEKENQLECLKKAKKSLEVK